MIALKKLLDGVLAEQTGLAINVLLFGLVHRSLKVGMLLVEIVSRQVRNERCFHLLGQELLPVEVSHPRVLHYLAGPLEPQTFAGLTLQELVDEIDDGRIPALGTLTLLQFDLAKEELVL